jgi:hypothetical protein
VTCNMRKRSNCSGCCNNDDRSRGHASGNRIDKNLRKTSYFPAALNLRKCGRKEAGALAMALKSNLASAGIATAPGPVSNTAVHSCGIVASVIGGFGGDGFHPGGFGAGGPFDGVTRASHSCTSLPQPSSPGGGACGEHDDEPAGHPMRIWK